MSQLHLETLVLFSDQLLGHSYRIGQKILREVGDGPWVIYSGHNQSGMTLGNNLLTHLGNDRHKLIMDPELESIQTINATKDPNMIYIINKIHEVSNPNVIFITSTIVFPFLIQTLQEIINADKPAVIDTKKHNFIVLYPKRSNWIVDSITY